MIPPITAELFASVDLVVGEPREWHFPWVGDLMLAEIAREQTTDTLLLGRRTYESFANAWPKRGDDVPLATQLNGMHKVVVSDSLADADATWSNTTVVRHGGDITRAFAALAEHTETRVTVAGSVSLVERLLAAGLLAELRLIVHPVVVGRGRRLFDGWSADALNLDLAESARLDRGARLDVYRPTATT